MKIEITKIQNKIELDTTTEYCGKDCIESRWEGLSEETTYAGIGNCFRCRMTTKGHFFF